MTILPLDCNSEPTNNYYEVLQVLKGGTYETVYCYVLDTLFS